MSVSATCVSRRLCAAKYFSKLVSVGVGGVVAGAEEGENASGAGIKGPATTGNAKLDAPGKAEEAVLDNAGKPDQTELVTAGTVGSGKLDEAGKTEPEKRGEAVGKIGSAFLVFAALGSALENDRKALSKLSAFWKNKLSCWF